MEVFGYFIVVGFVFISLFGIIGNSVAIYVFKPRQIKTRLKQMNLLVYYLAVIDLVSSILNPMLFLYWEFTDHSRWDFGSFLCAVLPSFRQISIVISLGMILLIVMERALSITTFKRVQLTYRKIKVFVFIIILLSILTEFDYIMSLENSSKESILKISCVTFGKQHQNAITFKPISEVSNVFPNHTRFMFLYTTSYTCDQIEERKMTVKNISSNSNFRLYEDSSTKLVNQTHKYLLNRDYNNVQCRMLCNPTMPICEQHTTKTVAYFSLGKLILRYSIALTIIIVCNMLIYKTISNRERKSVLMNQAHFVKPRRVLRILTAMAVIFFCLVLPKDVFDVVYQFLSIDTDVRKLHTLSDIQLFLALLQTANCVCNVFIYARLHKRFKTACRKSMKRISLTLTIKGNSKRSRVFLIEFKFLSGKNLLLEQTSCSDS